MSLCSHDDFHGRCHETTPQDCSAGDRIHHGARGLFRQRAPSGSRTAFATNLHADYFVSPQISLGPLAQIAATGDLFQFGFSGQAKLWFDLPDFDKRLRLNLQGGIGFLHSDLFSSDDSWLIPIGIGVDYALNEKLSLASTFLLNFTDIHTSGGNNAHIMPGLTFGIRF
jgi:hypothetical protein